MPTHCKPLSFVFQGCQGRRVAAAFDGGAITSNAGVLLLREIDRSIGILDRVADCFTDYRDPRLTEHSVGTLVRQRVMGITLGYEDLNDHDQLRHDPVLALLSGKLEGRKDCAPLAGKSTLNRLETRPRVASRAATTGSALRRQPAPAPLLRLRLDPLRCAQACAARIDVHALPPAVIACGRNSHHALGSFHLITRDPPPLPPPPCRVNFPCC